MCIFIYTTCLHHIFNSVSGLDTIVLKFCRILKLPVILFQHTLGTWPEMFFPLPELQRIFKGGQGCLSLKCYSSVFSFSVQAGEGDDEDKDLFFLLEALDLC